MEMMAESGIAIANKAKARKKVRRRDYDRERFQKETPAQKKQRNERRRKRTNYMTKVGTDDVEDKRLKHTDNKVDLSTDVKKIERKSNKDDGLREEDMKVVDFGVANEDIGNGGDTDVVGNITMGRNNNGGITSESAAGHNNGVV